MIISVLGGTLQSSSVPSAKEGNAEKNLQSLLGKERQMKELKSL